MSEKLGEVFAPFKRNATVNEWKWFTAQMYDCLDLCRHRPALHRLHLLTHFDYIYILRNGQVVDEGTFEHLNRSSLVFQEMWVHQRTDMSYETPVYPPLNVL